MYNIHSYQTFMLNVQLTQFRFLERRSPGKYVFIINKKKIRVHESLLKLDKQPLDSAIWVFPYLADSHTSSDNQIHYGAM